MLVQLKNSAVINPDSLENPIAVEESVVKNRDFCLGF
jgi:hypothetical protein